jgi:hypothetical protein
LQLTAYEYRLTLLEVSANEFRLLSPSLNCYEVASLLTILGELTIYCDVEGADGYTALCMLKLGIGGHIADKNYFIE